MSAIESTGSTKVLDGSNMAPGGVGNTETPPSARIDKVQKRDSSKKTWILTLRGSDGSNGSITLWMQQHTTCAVWQLEQGDGGYVHYQITMTLKKKQRLSWIKNHFAKSVHAEVVNNHDRAFDYTQKANSRIAGPFYFPEPVRGVKDPLENVELYDWQQEVMDIIVGEPDGRTIHWYWEAEGNKGKTVLAKHLALKHNACILGNGRKTDIAHAVDSGARIVCFVLPRDVEGRIAYGAIEQICDGLIFSGKYKSGTKIFDPPHVFVFANFPPEKEKMSEDRWNVVEITG